MRAERRLGVSSVAGGGSAVAAWTCSEPVSPTYLRRRRLRDLRQSPSRCRFWFSVSRGTTPRRHVYDADIQFRQPVSRRTRDNDAPMVVKGFVRHFSSIISGILNRKDNRAGLLGWTRQGRAALGGGQALIRSRPAGQDGPGDGRRIVRRPARLRQPIRGPGRPRELVSAGGCPQVRVDLAGDVTLEAADDFLLRQPFFAAPFDVGAGRRMRAHPRDDDPPQSMVGLAVAAGVEAVAGALAGGGGDRGDAA